MKRCLIFALLIAFSATFSWAQDPHFSQIQYNPLYLNPAFAGVTEYDKLNRVAGLYRDQWRTLPVPYSTTTASYDRLLKKFKKGWLLGGGVSFLYDKAGDGNLSIFNPNLTMNVGKYFNKEKQLLTIGITAGITIKTLDQLGLTFDNQYNGSTFDPNIPNGEAFSNNNVSYPNFTLGLNFRTKIKEKTTLDIGGTTSNLHTPNQNFLYLTSSELPARHAAYAKAKVGIKDNWNVQLGFFFQNQRKANQILVNAIAEVRFKEKKDFGLGFGLGYRAMDNDAAITYLSFLYKTLRVGAAYDFNVSDLRKATKAQGAFELALNYEFGVAKKQKPCPEFVPAEVITIVRVRYEDSLNNLVDTVLNRTIAPANVKGEYIDSIEVIVPAIVIKTEKPEITITNTSEKILTLLPIELFFDNDMPKTNSKENYQELYQEYTSKINEFSKASIDSSTTINSFFNQINNNYSRVDAVLKELEKLVDGGYTVTLEFRGFTSPLASEDYNKKLSERRISSIVSFIDNRLGDNFKVLAKDAQIVPFGETLSPKEISDNRNDKAKSVYSIAASKQRRVEIVGVRIEKQ
ncbi:MAG TPA: PorP/SprF family type IX secretion system membrane protein [Chitinophagales bacterium]|nr:PorP/SprF family type IX secretion system membrane protein [Chitinophagales bacterium]HQW79134.1 PorP/SprF family type IX secretion system membrane protein [Chitinophagales bacterium]